MKTALIALLLVLAAQSAICQETVRDSLPPGQPVLSAVAPYIIPAVLISYGVVGVESDKLKLFNSEIDEEVNEHIDEKFTIDDVSQYVPFVSVYALSALGVRSRHNLKDRTLVLATAYGMMGATVLGLKQLITLQRPDGTTYNSFPSGHTATAFMGAEFAYQELKDVSVWYGVGAFAIATGTGVFRMYNKRHWLTDVAAGAGIGILCTKLSYLIYHKQGAPARYAAYPTFGEAGVGLAFHMRL